MTDSPAAPLIRRARLMLEDRDFTKAHELVDLALNTDPENPDAYVVSLMAHHKAAIDSELGDLAVADLAEHRDFVKAIRFGDAKLGRRLEKYAASSAALSALEDRTRVLSAFKVARDEPVTAYWREQIDIVVRHLDESQRAKDEEAAREERAKRLIGQAQSLLHSAYPMNPTSPLRWSTHAVHPVADRVLVVCDHLIAKKAWGSSSEPHWRTSSLRAWLNSEVLAALPPSIRSHIVEVDNRARDDKQPVMDSVFILTRNEVGQYASKKLTYFWEKGDRGRSRNNEEHAWWLRDRISKAGARAIASDGTEYFTWGRERATDFERDYGMGVGRTLGVRPAFWLGVDEHPVEATPISPFAATARELCAAGTFRSDDVHRSINESERLSLNEAEGAAALAVALDPHNVDARVVALMVEHDCRIEAELGELSVPLSGEHYRIATQFASAKLRKRLEAYAASASEQYERQIERAAVASDYEDDLHDTEQTELLMDDIRRMAGQLKVLGERKEELAPQLQLLSAEGRTLDAQREGLSRLAIGERRRLDTQRADLEARYQSVYGDHLVVTDQIRELETERQEAMADRAQRRFRDSLRVRIVEDGRALLVATQPCASVPYHEPGGVVTWADSTLRAWLNEQYEDGLLSRVGRRAIETTHDGVTDRVFVLTADEALAKSNVDGKRVAIRHGMGGGGWTRGESTEAGREAVQIDERGAVRTYTFEVKKAAAVFPAMWVTI